MGPLYIVLVALTWSCFSGFAASVDSERRVTLRDITYNRFHAKRFNGTWVSDHEILFPDSDGGISLMNAVDGNTVQVI